MTPNDIADDVTARRPGLPFYEAAREGAAIGLAYRPPCRLVKVAWLARLSRSTPRVRAACDDALWAIDADDPTRLAWALDTIAGNTTGENARLATDTARVVREAMVRP